MRIFKKFFRLFRKKIGICDKHGTPIRKGDILVIPDSYTEPVLDFGQGPTYNFNHLAKVVYIKEFASYGIDITGSQIKGGYLKMGKHSFPYLFGDFGLDFQKEIEIYDE
jgi:hypothetical protein